MANTVYNNFKRLLLSGTLGNTETGTIKLLLTTSSYTFSQTHATTGSITNEISSSNYSAGGKKIESISGFTDVLDNQAGLSGNSVVWSGITATPYYGILYISGATPSSSYLIQKIDFNGTAVSSADFQVNWNAEGLLTIT